MRDESWKRRPRRKDWDSPEKSKERLDVVRRSVARNKQRRSKLSHYRSLAENHWAEFLPNRWEGLERAGELENALDRAAELTDRAMQSALDAGIPQDQAWEAIRGRYLLLEPEPEPKPEEEDPDDPNPNQALYDLSKKIHDAIMDIYDDLDGVTAKERTKERQTSDRAQTERVPGQKLTTDFTQHQVGQETMHPAGVQKKGTDPSWDRIPNPTPGRPHPFSEKELNEFQLRSEIRVHKMIDSINRTVEDYEKPRSERKLV